MNWEKVYAATVEVALVAILVAFGVMIGTGWPRAETVVRIIGAEHVELDENGFFSARQDTVTLIVGER